MTIINGDEGDNRLVGTKYGDQINGWGGDDTLLGRDGSDTLEGGTGANTLIGGRGDDHLLSEEGGGLMIGGYGDDLAVMHSGDHFHGGPGADYAEIHLAPDNAVDLDLTGFHAGDTLVLPQGTRISGVERLSIHMGRQADTAVASETGFVGLYGGGGDDRLTGTGVLTRLNGENGDDHLTGGGGTQDFFGGRGADVLTGGAGADSFVYYHAADSTPATMDMITDLENSDYIDLLMDANTVAARHQSFTLVAAFDGHAGELTVTYSAADDRTYISGDRDGDGVADVIIAATGDHSDFTHFA